jgi:hypothetical protein
VIRSAHHEVACRSVRQDREVFQSSCTSWSSKIIAVGTVDSSQRTSGSVHDSAYSQVYSSKSATCPRGGGFIPLVPRRAASRVAIRAWVPGVVSSAYTWSPSISSRSGHSASGRCRRPRPSATSASTPRPDTRRRAPLPAPLAAAWLAYRQEPKLIRTGRAGSGVRIRLGGSALPGSGHTSSPSSRTWYGVLPPGSRPRTHTSA